MPSKREGVLNQMAGRIGASLLSDREREQLTKRAEAKRYTGPAETPLNQREISKRLSKMPLVPVTHSALWEKEQRFQPFDGNGGMGRTLKPIEAPKPKSKGPRAKATAYVPDAERLRELVEAIKAGKL
jgi:hypothetical protein